MQLRYEATIVQPYQLERFPARFHEVNCHRASVHYYSWLVISELFCRSKIVVEMAFEEAFIVPYPIMFDPKSKMDNL
jgi:hypothetical protein